MAVSTEISAAASAATPPGLMQCTRSSSVCGVNSRAGRNQGNTVDTELPFGVRSALKIFSAVADTLAWAFHCKRIHWQLHYLYNLLFFGPADGSCAALQTALNTHQELGMLVAMDKLEGPASKLTFLSIQIDTRAGELGTL